MDAAEQVNRFENFFEQNVYEDLAQQAVEGKEFVNVDFNILSIFDPDLANELIEDPENVIKAAEIAVERFDIENAKDFRVRFYNLPESQQISIRNIRSKHLGKFIEVEGIVRQKTDVRPKVTSARFECPSCGNVITVLQLDTKFKEPTGCSCGRKGKFRTMGKELVDAQKITLEEAPENLDGGEQPKRMSIFLQQDLVSPISDRRTNPGSKIKIVGVTKEVPIVLAQGGKSTQFDLMIEVNYVIPVQEDFTDLKIDEEEIKEIKKLSKDTKCISKIVGSIAPTIYGHDKIKEALFLQMLGGVQKIRPDGVITRGDIHILLIGDPGAGKSQMLKRVTRIAPKVRFVAGKGASGAGLTASVVKDDFLKGWALEAGALVLANKGICCIDEMDKMTKEDTSAMHEALEQQCFHKDTIISLADGSEEKIQDIVESKFKDNKNVKKGIKCEILPVDDLEVLTTNWNKVFKTKVKQISKHEAFKEFYKVTFGNGRSITVTPGHPIWVFDGDYKTVAVEKLSGKEFVPIPKNSPIKGETQVFGQVFNPRAVENVKIPQHNDKNFFKIIGYLLAEGSKELNRKKLIGVNFTNKEEVVLEDFRNSMFSLFGKKPYEQIKIDENEPRTMLRYISTEIGMFFEKNTPEILGTSSFKQIPQLCMKGKLEDVKYMLQAMFEGDGHISKKERTIRAGYASNSKRMVEQVQDLLNRFGINSSVTEHNKSYKVSVTGYDNLKLFSKIGFVTEKKNKILNEYLESKKPIRSIKDNIPGIQKEFLDLLKKYDVKIVGKNKFATMKHDYLKKNKQVSRRLLKKAIQLLEKERDPRIKKFKDICNSEIRYEKIRKIEKIPNLLNEPVYDITVEPTHNFISQNLVLHNTITISKANIQATLRAETTVLAAANPKFGRFDPYEIISKQIDLPSTLINRFDLIFPIKDMPSEEGDGKLAQFILELHQDVKAREKDTELLDTDLVKKYISYARQMCRPKLTDNALAEIKKYYVKMRNSGSDEGGIKAIPINARNLEALVRLTEAHAKATLQEKATKKNARAAIELLHFCLAQVGLDPETGKIDIDRITTGITATQRGSIHVIKEIINELELLLGKEIAIDDIIKQAVDKGIKEEKAQEVIDGLKRAGDLFSPKHGFVSKI